MTLDDEAQLRPILRTCQIILGALVAGLIPFLLIVVFVIEKPATPQGVEPHPFGLTEWQHWPITSVAILFALIGVPASLLVPRIIATSGRRWITRSAVSTDSSNKGSSGLPADAEGKLALSYQNQLIVGAAINDGIVFLSLIAYMIERQTVALMLAIVLIFALAARFPTLDRMRGWILNQQELLLQDRNSGI